MSDIVLDPAANAIPHMRRWFDIEIKKLLDAPSPHVRDGILIGCPVWGQVYFDRFREFCLPTLASPDNFEALKHRTRVVLFTDDPGFRPLWNMTRDMQRRGLELQIKIIPDFIMKMLTQDSYNKYWILGTCQHILLQMAGRYGVGFHMLQPDHIYAHQYFPNLNRLIAEGKKAIAQCGISANIVAARTAIERYRDANGALTMSDVQLGDIGWRYLHKQMRMFCMNFAAYPDLMPENHYLFWQGRDTLSIACCHMNMAYMSPELCQRAAVHLPSTLDALLPHYFPDDFYVPTLEDKMTFIELSDDSKEAQARYVSFDEFANRCWKQVHFSDVFTPFFKRVSKIPISPQADFIPDIEIRAQHVEIVARLEHMKKDIALSQMRGMAGYRR